MHHNLPCSKFSKTQILSFLGIDAKFNSSYTKGIFLLRTMALFGVGVNDVMHQLMRSYHLRPSKARLSRKRELPTTSSLFCYTSSYANDIFKSVKNPLMTPIDCTPLLKTSITPNLQKLINLNIKNSLDKFICKRQEKKLLK